MKLPKDAQKKLKQLKGKLDKFQKQVTKKFDKYIMGIALIPPPNKKAYPGLPRGPRGKISQMASSMKPGLMPKKSDKKTEKQTHILVLIDDSDSKKMPKFELKKKLSMIIGKMAKEIDDSFAVQTIILSELWQHCYDGKSQILRTIAMGTPIFDKGMLAAIKISEVHKTMVLKKFEKYIVSYVLAGSLIQGRASKTSDIDVWIVIDDTDVKRMTRAELKDKLRAIIIGMGIEAGELTGIKNKLNIQVYILTDFWDNLKEANPIIFTLLRDGVPFYDRGMFMPWKQLLKMGKIKPSSEAIDMFMSTGERMLKTIDIKMKKMAMEDCYYAILTPSQAALMLYGVPPPAPSETADLLRDIFVKKEGLLEEKHVKILDRNIKLRKDVEHGNKKNISGKELDKLKTDADKYLKRIKELFEEIQEIKEEQSVIKIYDRTVTVIRDILRLEGVEKVDDLEIVERFEDEMVDQGKIPEKYLRKLNRIMKAKKDHDAGKLTKSGIARVKKDSKKLTKFLVEYMQRKRGRELERTKIRVKHGNKYGEVLLLGKDAFIIHDIDHEEKEITRAKIGKNGGLGTVKGSSLEELEKALAKIEIPPKVFIKEQIFEDLKEIFGKDVEVLVNY
ncbi:MAG: hypothetical protein MAG795_00486 [Candidatus Woesearchaeota archaeon]|nr:hypothetical protein [Candidatus Woesearchaeota archaeon]